MPYAPGIGATTVCTQQHGLHGFGVARVFGARGADFRLAPPDPPKNVVIHQNLQNLLNCSQNLAI